MWRGQEEQAQEADSATKPAQGPVGERSQQATHAENLWEEGLRWPNERTDDHGGQHRMPLPAWRGE